MKVSQIRANTTNNNNDNNKKIERTTIMMTDLCAAKENERETPIKDDREEC